jgi:hypothetical protein
MVIPTTVTLEADTEAEAAAFAKTRRAYYKGCTLKLSDKAVVDRDGKYLEVTHPAGEPWGTETWPISPR